MDKRAISFFEVLRTQFDLQLDDLRFQIEFIDLRFTSLIFYSSIINLKIQL
jgi:hypothetical protein